MHSLTPDLSQQMERTAQIYGAAYLIQHKDGTMEVLDPQRVLVVQFHGNPPTPRPQSFDVGVLGDALDTTSQHQPAPSVAK